MTHSFSSFSFSFSSSSFSVSFSSFSFLQADCKNQATGCQQYNCVGGGYYHDHVCELTYGGKYKTHDDCHTNCWCSPSRGDLLQFRGDAKAFMKHKKMVVQITGAPYPHIEGNGTTKRSAAPTKT